MDEKKKRLIQQKMHIAFQDCQNADMLLPKMGVFMYLQEAINEENEEEIKRWRNTIEKRLWQTDALIIHALSVITELKKEDV
jgi:hypothetical protein